MHLTKRQREIYEYLKDHIRSRGYAPSIAEIGKQFHLSSPATVHKHLAHLEEKGLIRKQQNLSRAIEIIPESGNTLSYHVLGEIAAGKPIEALDQLEVVDLLPDAGDKDVFVLRVKGNSMIEDHIQNGDYVIVERRNVAENGETVVALIDNDRVTLKRFYREGERIRLQPSHPNMKPIFVREGDFAIQGVVISVLRKFDR
ncbi:transcriptional repressor LexA [Nitrospinae bacterium]|nr:transcriptional repressor LexA [Nitrospinota bacterium]|tara:strand:+ start:733 stop:1332 length:600 start_codon:yes stop_codon:yes gene_type:complete